MTWTTRPRSDLGPLKAIVQGQGPTCVLLHGVGLQAEAWAPVIDRLSSDFRVIAPDMPGHGASDMQAPLEKLRDFSAFVEDALAEPAVVIGHSMGAMIALDLALRWPSKLRGMAALNAIFERCHAAKEAVQRRAADLDGATAVDPAATLTRWFGDAASPERDACAHWMRIVDPRGYKAAYTVFAAENGPNRSDLAGLHMPALFMTGGQEPNSTPQMSEEMAALSPMGRSLILPDAAHMMPMTHAAETCDVLIDFARAAFAEKGD